MNGGQARRHPAGVPSSAPPADTGWHVREASPASPSDIEAIIALRGQGADEAFAAARHLREIHGTLIRERVDRAKLESELVDPACHVLIATDRGGRVVGTAQLTVDGEVAEFGGCVAARSGAGIGSALMNARIDLARGLGVRTVWLETDTVNPGGIAHAARHGFTPVGRRPGRLIPGNEVIRLELRL